MRSLSFSILAVVLVLGCKKTTGSKPAPSASVAAVVSAPAASSAPPPPAGPSEITFKKRDPAVGTVVSVVDASDMVINITKPKQLDTEEMEKAERKIEILAAEGRTVSKVRVTYVDKAVTQVEDGKETTERPGVRGKGYVVDYKGGKVQVTGDSKKTVKKEETDIVVADFAQELGRPDKILSTLPDAPMRAGDAAPGLAEWVKDALSQMGNGVEIPAATATLKEVKRDAKGPYGSFDVSARVAMKARGVTITMNLTGALEVREDGRPQSLELAGPLDMKGAGAEGTGKMTLTQKRVYP